MDCSCGKWGSLRIVLCCFSVRQGSPGPTSSTSLGKSSWALSSGRLCRQRLPQYARAGRPSGAYKQWILIRRAQGGRQGQHE